MAELRPAPGRTGLRFGSDEGRITMGDDFDAPLLSHDEAHAVAVRVARKSSCAESDGKRRGINRAR